ncbi:hypothetical protein ABXT43_02095 [Candidatus Pelagibacter sp. Uisw_114]
MLFVSFYKAQFFDQKIEISAEVGAYASVKTTKSKISKTSLSTDNDPPMNANGTDDIRNEKGFLRLIFASFNIVNTISRNDNNITKTSHSRKD